VRRDLICSIQDNVLYISHYHFLFILLLMVNYKVVYRLDLYLFYFLASYLLVSETYHQTSVENSWTLLYLFTDFWTPKPSNITMYKMIDISLHTGTSVPNFICQIQNYYTCKCLRFLETHYYASHLGHVLHAGNVNAFLTSLVCAICHNTIL
jgi:hypothetical protein